LPVEKTRGSIIRRPHENPRVGLALIFHPCLCVMAKRLRDVCALPESECPGAPDAASSSALICRRRGDESHFNSRCWFLIRASSRRLLRYGEFENRAIIALGGIGRDAAAPSGHRSAMTLPAPRRASSRNPPFSSVSRPSARRFRPGDGQFDDRQGYFRRGQG